MSTILITGSSGFIGYNLAKALLKKGHRVIGIDNENNDYDPKIKMSRSSELIKNPNFKFLKSDIVHDEIYKNLDIKNVDYFVHLAARDFYYDHPHDLNYSLYVESQVLGTARMFELAKKLNAKKFIFASTHSVYGKTKKGTLTEKKIHPNPISPHGASKLAAEEVVRYMSIYHNLPAISLRIFSVYGSDMAPHMLIPSLIKSFQNKEELKQYSDLTKASRDFIYIDDVVDFIIASLNKRIKFQTINIASGKSTRLYEVAKLIAKIMNKDFNKLKIKDENKNFKHIVVEKVTTDISRAKKILRYSPKIELKEGLEKTVTFFMSAK